MIRWILLILPLVTPARRLDQGDSIRSQETRGRSQEARRHNQETGEHSQEASRQSQEATILSISSYPGTNLWVGERLILECRVVGGRGGGGAVWHRQAGGVADIISHGDTLLIQDDR